MMNNNVKGIYIHIPFCKDICFYCDFCKIFYEEELVDRYLNSLENEYNSYKIVNEEIETIYIGGGTPSSLNERQIEKLMSIIKPDNYVNLKEFTFEANPEQLDENKIKLLKLNKVNRISLGVQSFSFKILKSLNRHHNSDDVVRTINLLKEAGILNISIDLMYGFNNQTMNDVRSDLDYLKKLEVNHVAVYSLILESGSVFYNKKYMISDNEYEFGEYINDFLVKNGYENYEVSNYALDSKYSQHNMLYWNNERYFGIGLGAGGFIDNYRYYNTKSITKYLDCNTNQVIEYYDSKYSLLKDEILVSFRIFNGIDLKKLNKKYDICFEEFFKNSLVKNNDKIYIDDNKLYFSKKGKLFLNDVIIDFVDEVEEG